MQIIRAVRDHDHRFAQFVGYDEAAETYTVRHPFVSEQYAVRYDAIGHADPVEWFNVRIFESPPNHGRSHSITLPPQNGNNTTTKARF